MNIIERIISQEVDRFFRASANEIQMFKIIRQKVKNVLYDPSKRDLILVVDRDDYENNRGIYIAIKKFLESYAPFREFMHDVGVDNFNVVYAFPYSEKEYYHLSSSNVTPISRILVQEEKMKIMLSSLNTAQKKIRLLDDSLQALVKESPSNKRTQLQFLLELLLSQPPTPTGKAVIDDYDIYKFLKNIYSYVYGTVPVKRDIQAVITEENAELFKTILDRHFLINWDNVEGKNLREKVINVLLQYGFGTILEILASVNFEMVNLLVNKDKNTKKSKSKQSKSTRKSSKKRKKEVKKQAQKEIEITEEELSQHDEDLTKAIETEQEGILDDLDSTIVTDEDSDEISVEQGI